MAWKDVWITAAEDNAAARNAIALATSLRQSMTSKKLLVVQGPTVSSDLTEILLREFDGVIPLNPNINTETHGKALNFENSVKIWLYSGKLFEHGIFIAPSVLVVSNVDYLFDIIFHSSVNIQPGPHPSQAIDFKSSFIFPVKPSAANHSSVKNYFTCNNSLPPELIDLQVNTSQICFLHGITLHSDESHLTEECLTEKDVKFIKLPHKYTQVSLDSLCEWGNLEPVIQDIRSHSFPQAEQNEAPQEIIPLERMDEEPIAIIGMAGRFPGANDIDEFWNLLIEKGDAIIRVPESRWPEDQVKDVTTKQRSTNAGFLKVPVDEFDAKFFGVSPKEAELMDPQQRMLLEVSWEALEDAAVNPHSLNGTSTGIFTGTWRNDYETLMNLMGFGDQFFRAYMGNSYGAGAGRLAFFYGTTGANVATDSGCSSSIVAVGLAARSLRRKETSLAMACGVNLILKPYHPDQMPTVSSPDGHCKTFDEAADGFGRAEGCAVLILKRLSDALSDGDNIRAVIRGYGEAQEGPSRSMGTPTVEVEALAMKLALSNAQVEPKEVSFLESHGTGTTVGDPMEMAAIAQVYSKQRTSPLMIGSVKTNVGHTESVSGITGIIKTVLALEKQVIPPLRSLETLNSKIDLSLTPAVIPLEPTLWPQTKNLPRIAGVSSFGITGTDAHVILQESPTSLKLRSPTELPLDILALSGRTSDAVHQLIQKYGVALQEKPLRWGDVAFTTNTGRAHFNEYRAAIVATDAADFHRQVERNSIVHRECPAASQKPKVVFLCTGQGSQYPGMSQELYQTSADFRRIFDKYDAIVHQRFGLDLKRALWKEPSLLQETMYIALSIYVVSVSLADLWISWGIIPDIVMGHSMGEFISAVISNVLTFDDALTLLSKRSELADTLERGDLIILKSDEKEALRLLKTSDIPLEVAAMNSPAQTALAGTRENIGKFKTFCTNNGVKAHVMNTTHAFHSSMMDPALPELRKWAETLEYSKPTCTFISSIDGSVVTSLDAEYWVRNMRQPVNFVSACETLAAIPNGIVCLEIGAQPVLSSLVAQNLESTQSPLTLLPALRRNQSDWRTTLDSLASLYTAGFDINWKQFYSNVGASKLPSLPTYPFQRKKFWFEKPEEGFTGNLSTGKKLHPLLHFPLPNASNTKIFQTQLSLENEEYLKDHVVGGHLIFPAAGYVEMALAVAHSGIIPDVDEFQLPQTPLLVRDLTVEAPLALLEKEINCLQTIVVDSPDDPKWSSVTINRHQKTSTGGKSWIRHAAALVSHFAPDVSEPPEAIDIASMTSSFQEEDPAAFYAQLKSAGLEFGPTFQSLQRFWRCSNQTLAELILPEEISKRFVCHPLAIDAMIQSIFASGNEHIAQLHVPVKIAQFTWFARESDSKLLYIHVTSEPKDFQVTLRDGNGTALALMTGVTVIPTTAATISKALESQRLILPQFLEEDWLPLPLPRKAPSFPNLLQNGILSLEEPTSEILYELREGAQLLYLRCSLHLLKALVEIGWSPNVGDSVDIKQLCNALEIVPQKRLFVRRIFDMLSKYTDYVEGSDMSFTVTQAPPSIPQLEETLADVDRKINHFDLELECVQTVAPKTADVLRGRDSVLSILFGEDQMADKMYTRFHLAVEGNELLAKIVRKSADLLPQDGKAKPTLKILEVGAGTGCSTRFILPALQESGIDFSYTFTDISAGFFQKAQEEFAPWKDRMTFKVLDIEKDPRTQGFVVEDYDILIASLVLHATRNMTETMANVRQLLRHSGVALIGEAYEPPPQFDSIFGLVDGYWLFEDFHLRPYHCFLPEASWPQLLEDSGFSSHRMLKVPSGNGGVIVAQALCPLPKYLLPASHKIDTWFVINGTSGNSDLAVQLTAQLSSNHGRRVVSGSINSLKAELECLRVEGILFVAAGTNFEAYEPTKAFLEVLQTFLSTNTSVVPKLVLATVGALIQGDQGIAFPHNATLWGMSKSFRSENSIVSFLNVDLDPHESSGNNATSLLRLLWSTPEDFIAVRGQRCFAGRLKKLKFQNTALQLPPSQRCCLIFPKTNAISDLQFGPFEKKPVEADEVEVQVRAAGLNFKDILNVLKPTAEFEKHPVVGGDVAGVVVRVGSQVTRLKVGDPVIGCLVEVGGLSSHTVVSDWKLAKLPPNFSFEDGCTLPIVFATAYCCLVDVAGMTQRDTVLIHAASGGVGLAAIQVAREFGAKIIATAGSRRKRRFLREIIGLEHVFHSRDLSYAKEIHRVTAGKGVDIVLNCLTSAGFKEASLDVLSHNGRFIEMSKLNVWSEADVKEIRPDVFYKIVDLAHEPEDNWKSFLFHLEDFMRRGKVHPLPYVAFETVEIRAALSYLQQARHIGKVVCRFPVDMEGGRRQLLFNDRSTYLITGGLGGIGLEAARWMASEGAKFLVLCGRRPPNDKANEVIKELNALGHRVVALQIDVGQFQDCQRLIEDINEGRIFFEDETFPKLRGIQHLAGCLSDGTFPSQTWAKYEQTFNAKVKGAWNLHELTKHAVFPLDHFILYSSAVATFGASGQSNHAAGNRFLDALAHFRVSMGLPGTSVNWGQWGQVGVAASLEFTFCTPFTPLQAFTSLKEILKNQKTQVTVTDTDPRKLRATFPWMERSYGKQLLESSSSSHSLKNGNKQSSEKFWQSIETAKGDPKEINLIFRRLLTEIITQIVKLDESDSIDIQANFQDIGLDSLMMIELKNAVQSVLGPKVTLTSAIISDANSIATLATKLTDAILADPKDALPEATQTTKETPSESSQTTLEPKTPHDALETDLPNTKATHPTLNVKIPQAS